jgi:hypothetical protein
MEGAKKPYLHRETKTRAPAEGQKLPLVAPAKSLQEWLTEKALLEREIALRQRRLASINRHLHRAGLLTEDQSAKPLAPRNKLTLIDAIEKIANENSKPVSKAELRRHLCSLGLPLENFNNYFYTAIRRLKRRRRISVFEDGSIWRFQQENSP